MRRALAWFSLVLAAGVAACDFDDAYQRYCDGNPACFDAGTDAATPPPDASAADVGAPDVGAPDAGSPDAGPHGLLCHPEVLAPGVNGGPGGTPDEGLDSCRYEERCDGDSRTCEPIDHGSCGMAARKEGSPANWGPIIVSAEPIFLHRVWECFGGPATEVTITFYAPNPIYDAFRVVIRPPPWDPDPPYATYDAAPDLWPSTGDTVGRFRIGVCDLTDPSDWSVGLEDKDFLDHPRRGNLMCLSP